MLSNMFATLLFSYLAAQLFNKGVVPERWDVYKVKTPKLPPNGILMSNGSNRTHEEEKPEAQNETELMLTTNQQHWKGDDVTGW